jgi:hypothetical protein
MDRCTKAWSGRHLAKTNHRSKAKKMDKVGMVERGTYLDSEVVEARNSHGRRRRRMAMAESSVRQADEEKGEEAIPAEVGHDRHRHACMHAHIHT